MTGRLLLTRKYLPLYLLLLMAPAASFVLSIILAGDTAGASAAIFSLGFAGILSSIATFITIRRIDKSVESSREAAGKFSEGNLAYRIPVPASEVTANLASDLNRMASQLGSRIREIEVQSLQVETILRSMIEGVIATDQGGLIVKFNEAAAALLNSEPVRLTGSPLTQSIRSVELSDLVHRVIAEGKPGEIQTVWSTDSGDRHLNIKVSPLTNDDGSSNGAVIVLSDITRLRKLEQARKDFVANVSHELKTPLTSIKGFVETLLDGALQQPEEAKRFCEIIAIQVDRLQAIIEDLLSLSRIEQEIERGAIKLSAQNVCDILKSAISHVQTRAAEKNIAIEMDGPESVMVAAHPTLLEQAAVNLLENAIKYSETGKPVHVRVNVEARECRIDFCDQGIGISPEHFERIFERFYRVDKSRSRKQGGTGLGLSIVKHIITAHGGSIAVSSKTGIGSTFSVRLPAIDNH